MDASAGAEDEPQDAAGERRRRRTIALAIGFALLALGVVATLSRDAKGRIRTNGVPAQAVVAIASADPGGAGAGAVRTVCQDRELIPSGTGAIRIALTGFRRVPPRLSLTVSEGEAVRDAGRAARWDADADVLVPLAHPLARSVVGSVCIAALAPEQRYWLRGAAVGAFEGARAGGRRLPGRVHLEYLAADGGSWWSSIATIARRMGLGHAWSGASVPLLIVLLTLTSIALGAWQLARSDS